MPEILREMIGMDFLEMIMLLGKRTAELHIALSSDREDPSFSPEPFSILYQRSIYQSMQSLTKRVFEQMKKNIKGFLTILKSLLRRYLIMKRQLWIDLRQF